ncbi:Phosphate ABC transporter, periplasmic phosphate-binding protein PstS (TC 3.A.1.7.1) [hydrothermal vent metagenome]|uniref:Phosphate ABC transporter, periplasmic phosphate-binding protein PstS (TC 3.A.1.7.1) n=1 Tax=hydrothermal vent metagenome TaxID=652676 RepID=A0A3B0XLU2_9ZZZZ
MSYLSLLLRVMNRRVVSFVAITLALLMPLSLQAASASETATSGTITGAGAHFAWVIFDALKDELEKTTGKKIELFGKNSNLGMGCNAGIKLAQQNRHNHETFGFVCCPLSQQEMDEKHIRIYPLADEPVLIIVNRKNPLTNLSKEQVRSIFRGDITNWKAVGGWDKPIVVVTRLHCKKRPGHWKTILPDAKDFVKQRLNVTSAAEMVKLVTQFETAFGHLGSTWEYGAKSNVKALRVDNVAATAENLKNKTYPFHRRLSAITNMNPSKDVLKTIEQVQYGKSFEAIAKKYNLLPLN